MSYFRKAFNFGKSKHKKLPEDWGESIKAPVTEGITFYVKYLGSTLVAEPSNDAITAEAIRTIIAMAKASSKKLNHVALTVRPTGISTQDAQTKEKHLDVSIYRISYCSADATYDRVVAFIATNKNETFECHAFLTSKRKVAQAAALTISQAFTIAFEKWKQHKGDVEDKNKTENGENGKEKNGETKQTSSECALIDLTGDDLQHTSNGSSDDFEDDMNDSFMKLAESRKDTVNNSHVLPSNLSYNNIQDLNNFLSSNDNCKDEKFFSEDNRDDFLLL